MQGMDGNLREVAGDHSALLVVSFGTSYEETRKRTIEAIEEDLKQAFPGRRFYRAWTSERIRKKLRETQGLLYDNVKEAMERMLKDGVRDVLIQPTHMMPGVEYEATKDVIRAYEGRFETLRLGAPLLAEETDIRRLAEALEEIFSWIEEREMLALMGHGSPLTRFPIYEKLEERLKEDGFGRFCVGTVEYEPGFNAVLRQVREKQPEKVYLTPMLVVAGDHAINDMAGEDPDSWKSVLEKEGYETECIVRGMGEYKKIRDLYVCHAREARLLSETEGSGNSD